MAVIVKYVVERNGVEKMTFTSKKDADAYDKMLDIADGLSNFLNDSPLEIGENVAEELSLYLAQNAASLQQLLKGGKIKPIAIEKSQDTDSATPKKPAKKPAVKKAA